MSVISSLADVDPRSLIGKGRVGLLDSTGTYDVDRYAWAYEFWKRQQQTHWMGEEVPLGADLKDWASDRVTPNERALLTQIFRFFTQSDIEVGDNYLKRYIPIFQPLAVQMMMAAFTNMETVHVDAYALLLKTLGMPKTEFEAFRDYAEMRAKADYMHEFGVDTVADVARTLAMFGAFTEGMSLFASFAMLLNFPRHNKMNGMGQIVSWSVRDESLHCEGVLPIDFLRFRDLLLDSQVFTMRKLFPDQGCENQAPAVHQLMRGEVVLQQPLVRATFVAGIAGCHAGLVPLPRRGDAGNVTGKPCHGRQHRSDLEVD